MLHPLNWQLLIVVYVSFKYIILPKQIGSSKTDSEINKVRRFTVNAEPTAEWLYATVIPAMSILPYYTDSLMSMFKLVI